MKRSSSWFVLAFVLGMVVISVGLSYAGTGFFNHYQSDVSKQQAPVRCAASGITHYVNITHDIVQPAATMGRLCDKLTIMNHDDVLRLIAFGPHEHHVPYDGIEEKVIYKNESLTVTLNQTGSFTFHDHLNDSVIGKFTVSP